MINCNEVLASDLFNYSKTTKSSDFNSSFITWVDSKKFQSTKNFQDETQNLGLSIPTKIGNVGFDFDQGNVKTSENITYSSFSEFLESKSKLKTDFFHEVKNTNSQIDAWTTCIKELIGKGGLFITNERTNSKSIAIEIWFQPKTTKHGPIILKNPEITNGKFLTKLNGIELSAVTHKTFTFNIDHLNKDVIINFNTNNIDYSGSIIIKANKPEPPKKEYVTIVTLKSSNTKANTLYIAEKSMNDAFFEIIDNNLPAGTRVVPKYVNFHGNETGVGEVTVRLRSTKPEIYLQSQTDLPKYGVISLTFQSQNKTWYSQVIHQKDEKPIDTPYKLISN